VLLWCLGVPLSFVALLRRGAVRGQLNDRNFSDRYGFLYEGERRGSGGKPFAKRTA
jgi:hypothetical protein